MSDRLVVRRFYGSWARLSLFLTATAIAGNPPTARLIVNPVPAKVGSYPPGTMIMGNELRADAGGFRAWFEFQIDDWDPNGDGEPGVKLAYVRIDGSGYLDSDAPGDQPDLAPAVVACATHATCVAAFGESWAKCELGVCKYAYADKLGAHPNSWCADTGSGPCDQNDCATATLSPVCGPIYPTARPDDGTVKYFASLVLDIPAGARGRYTVDLVSDETFLGDDFSPPNDVPTLLERGFVVHIPIGMCCYGAGSPNAGCVDSVTQGECNALPAPRFWLTGVGCESSCTVCGSAVGCDDGDACTTEGCIFPEGGCTHTPKAGWNSANSCCNAVDGSVDLLITTSPCHVPQCSLPGGRGDLVLQPLPNGTPCAYNDLCFSGGTCDPSGRCVGTLATDPGCGKNRCLTFYPDDDGELTAIRVRMITLQDPDPPNAPGYEPPDFSAYEAGVGCTDPAQCERWVGRPQTYPDCTFDNPAAGAFRSARLQCTPYYHDWGAEGLFHVTGAEIIPSSLYDVEFVPISCQGSESTCPDVPPAVSMRTSRHGDVAPLFNPPSSAGQPDALDVAALVDKYKCLPGSPPKTSTQTQPNVPESYRQFTGLDIVNVIDGFKGFAYPFEGPCPCPSQVSCGAVPCTTSPQCGSGICYRECAGGMNDGAACQFAEHCPGGVCGPGFCRDACARCTP